MSLDKHNIKGLQGEGGRVQISSAKEPRQAKGVAKLQVLSSFGGSSTPLDDIAYAESVDRRWTIDEGQERTR